MRLKLDFDVLVRGDELKAIPVPDDSPNGGHRSTPTRLDPPAFPLGRQALVDHGNGHALAVAATGQHPD